MLKGHPFRAAHLILLAVAINALAVTFWLALTSIIPIGITPGFGLSPDIAAGTDWVGVVGPSILWLTLFAVAGSSVRSFGQVVEPRPSLRLGKLRPVAALELLPASGVVAVPAPEIIARRQLAHPCVEPNPLTAEPA